MYKYLRNFLYGGCHLLLYNGYIQREQSVQIEIDGEVGWLGYFTIVWTKCLFEDLVKTVIASCKCQYQLRFVL